MNRVLKSMVLVAVVTVSTFTAQAAKKPEVVFVKESARRFTFNSLPHIGQQLGFDRKHGFVIKFAYAKHVVDAAKMVIHSGNLNYVGTDTFLVRRFHQKVKVLGVIFNIAPYSLVVRKGIMSIEDLGGKAIVTYGCGKPGLAAQQMYANFAKHNLSVVCGKPRGKPDSKTIYLIPLPNAGGQVNMLRNDSGGLGVPVVAMTALPQTVSKLLRERKGNGSPYHVLLGPAFFNQAGTTVPMGILAVKPSFLKKYPGLAAKILAFHKETIQWVRNNKKQALIHIAFAMKLGNLAKVAQLPTKFPADVNSAEVEWYYDLIVKSVPPRICMPRSKFIAGVEFYNGKPIPNLSKAVLPSAICEN